MKWIFKSLKAVSVALCAFNAFGLNSANAETVYKVGIVPQFEARRIAEVWTPILDELEKRTGEKFVLEGSPNIPAFERGFADGVYDFAYMNPYHALVAAQKQNYEPIVRDGARKLFGILVVAKNADYTDVKQLQGKKVAFPAPNALGAALLMRADLDRVHGITYEADYVATHTSAYLNVALGETDAAGGVMATFNRLDDRLKEELVILYETTKLPPHPLTVHPRVSRDVAQRVQDALLQMAQTEEGQAMLLQVPFKQVVSATLEEYAVLKELSLENYYVNPAED